MAISIGSVLTIRSIALVIIRFACVDRFVRAERNAIDFGNINGLDDHSPALAAVTITLYRKTPEPHTFALLALSAVAATQA